MSERPSTTTEWVEQALVRYERPLIRYAARITRDPDLARDVVQETFMRLCEAERKNVDGHLAGWLFTVCRNKALNVRKKEGQTAEQSEDETASVASAITSPSAAAARNETQAMIFEAVKTLPDEQQEAFRLKYWDELSYREISQIMDISLGKVSNLIASALKSVREELSNIE